MEAPRRAERVDPRVSGSPTNAPGRAADHLGLWLAGSRVRYGGAAREGFVRAHPTLFGRAYWLTLRGYERWRTRGGLSDTLGAFAGYIAHRHQRWMDSLNAAAGLAPCLLGSASTSPCWSSPEEDDGSLVTR
jgi:hypothetical protein